MNKIPWEILTVDIDLTTKVEYIPKVIIFFNHKWLIDNYTARWLEDNKVFAFCFDTTPPDLIDSMRDYQELVDAFPDSNRVPEKSFYIGNYDKGDWDNIIHQMMAGWMWKYEVVDRESQYTDTIEEGR